jgi:fatty-acid desaturase
MNVRVILLIAQLYIHLSFLIGLFVIPWTVTVPSILVNQILFVGLCGTVFYHRVVTHNNPVHPLAERFLFYLSWLGCSGSLIAWAGTHRQHHRFSDTDKDPHCPAHVGRLKAYWWSSGTQSVVRYIPDLLRKPHYVFQHAHYFKVLLLLHAFGAWLLPFKFYWMVLISPAFLMWFAGSSINAFGHDKKGPINISFLAFLHGGEGWHVYHHEVPTDPNFGHPLDWGYWIYRAISYK